MDWIAFLDRYGVEYVTSGPNVSRGNINIHCPMCGDGDPSHHLGISLEGAGWGCWRDPDHRGKSAAKLIRILINCSWDQAYRIAGERLRASSDLQSRVEMLRKKEQQDSTNLRSLKLPDTFLPFRDIYSFKLYRSYLRARRYTEKQINRMTDVYGLRYCTKGGFKGRIIFPVYHENELMTWTGRTIYPSEELRYKTLTTEEDRAKILGLLPALGNIKDYLLWYDDLLSDDCETIVIVEGPFDALRVRVLGERFGVTATCFFTSAPSARQVELLHIVLRKYKRGVLLLDQGTLSKSTRISREFRHQFSGAGVEIMTLPKGVKDPGDLTKNQFTKLFFD